jgi:hypothetical protein
MWVLIVIFLAPGTPGVGAPGLSAMYPTAATVDGFVSAEACDKAGAAIPAFVASPPNAPSSNQAGRMTHYCVQRAPKL